MTINEYQELAMTTLNKQMSEREILMNGVMGLCGESGEAIDIVKKHVFQGHDLNRDHLIEEIGDVAWYLAELATVLNISLEEVLTGNINKLKARYPEGFDSNRSIERADNRRQIFECSDKQPDTDVVCSAAEKSSDPDEETKSYFDNLDEEFRRQMGIFE